MSPALTIFSTCKPFEGSAAVRQRDALETWRRLRPRPEVLVFGDEPGVAEACAAAGARAIPALGRTPAGAPRLPDLVAGAEAEATGDALALVNADILLTSGLGTAVEAVAKGFDRWLLIVRRWNLALGEPFDFAAPDWEGRLISRARSEGRLEAPYGGVDVFVFPRGLWGDEALPPFAIGRGRWDSGILFEARRRGIAVIDATPVALVAHPDHDYDHHPQGRTGVFEGPDSLENERLLGGPPFVFSALNATHVLTPQGIRTNRVRSPLLWLRRSATLPALDPRMRPLAPLVAAAAPAWRFLRRLAAQRS